jgi:hypothetical protein
MPKTRGGPCGPRFFDSFGAKPWRGMYLIFYRKVSVKSQNKTRWVPMALCPRAEAATALPGSSRARTGQALMLNGIVKAAVIVGIAVMADQFFADGTYTDAALSMLRQIEHSFQ